MISAFPGALSGLRSREDGQALVEYALILALVAAVSIAILFSIGALPSSVFSSINADF